MSHVLDLRCRIFACEKLKATELSVFTGVAGCGWFKASKEIRIGMASWQLKNTPPVSLSELEDRVLRNILQLI